MNRPTSAGLLSKLLAHREARTKEAPDAKRWAALSTIPACDERGGFWHRGFWHRGFAASGR